MNFNIIILCAGSQDRFGDDKLKQFLEFDGEKLIERTIRQCAKYGNVNIISTRKEFNLPGIHFIKINHSSSTCETILKTKFTWSDFNVILLGDVYYTDEAIEKIFVSTDLKLFTDKSDFFAIRFESKDKLWLKEWLYKAIGSVKKQGLPTCPILEFYRTIGCPENLCEFISDKTQDFDRDFEYEDFLNGRYKNNLYKL